MILFVALRYIFDQTNSSLDTFTPLKSLPRWDKQIRSSGQSIFLLSFRFRSHFLSRQQKVDGSDSVFAAGLDDPRSVVVQVLASWFHIIALGTYHQLSFAVVPAWKQFAVFKSHC
jgi:hypothetical protein